MDEHPSKTDAEAGVTATLAAIRDGDRDAKDQLVGLIYDDLRATAARFMRRERVDHTLQPTALVNESLVRLLDTSSLKRIEDRGHLIAAATVAFKRVLIDHARARSAQKRSRGGARVPLTDVEMHATAPAETAGPPDAEEAANPFDLLLDWYDEQGLDILVVDQALDELRELERRWFDVVLLRFFGGFTIDQTAELLAVSPRTVNQDWNQARAWLRVKLEDEHAGGSDAAASPDGPLRGGEPSRGT
jgi:RNA polymerase sigma factor (sigma-70 family)